MQAKLFRMAAGLLYFVAIGTLAAGETSDPASGPTLELNRLQAVDAGCRLHVVVNNPHPVRHDKFQLDLVVFDGDGVIARRVALDTAPVRPRKTSVYAFDVNGLKCEQVGRVLLNDVVGCTLPADAGSDCVSTVAVSSRAGVPFVK